MSDRYAFVDESYIVATRHYLLAAVVVREEMLDDVRASVRAVRRRRRDAFHWHGELDRSRTAMLELIAATSDLQIVVISRPVPPRRQERARARCTESLLAQLQVLDPPVHDVVLESRTHVLDRRDGTRIEGLRASMRIGPGLRFCFATKSEPLLWIADAVAGAESARVRGDDRYAQALGNRLIRINIPGVP